MRVAGIGEDGARPVVISRQFSAQGHVSLKHHSGCLRFSPDTLSSPFLSVSPTMIPPSIPPPGQTKIAPIEPSIFDDDDEGWQDMPIIRDGDDFANGLDEEDQKRYHYIPQAKKDKALGASNATGNVLDIDYEGAEWRSKVDQNESEYTRVRLVEEDDQDEVHLRTRYLFDEDKAMTPLSQMQATKNLLTEAQRIAYVGLCSLTCREMADRMKAANQKELNQAIKNMQLWSLKIMGRLYYHMELATEGEHTGFLHRLQTEYIR